jgi:dethiobiotin synthetase
VNRTGAARIIFITGTDTGVGKTLLTGLLLYHLRRHGCHALAMKPFATGSRADAEFLLGLQEKELTLDEITPFFFSAAVAPLVAARKTKRSVHLPEVLRRVNRLAARCQCLLIEGIGGLMVPLGEGYCVLDLIRKLGCEVILVARNRLGTLSHTLLSASALQDAGITRVKTVVMGSKTADDSTGSNGSLLRELLCPVAVFEVSFLGRDPERLEVVERAEKKLKKTLAQILA